MGGSFLENDFLGLAKAVGGGYSLSVPPKKTTSNSVAFDWQQLIRRASALREPTNYFTGQFGATAVTPRNILIFHRTQMPTPGTGDDLHNRYVLACAMKGSGKAAINNSVIDFRQGQFFLVFPKQFHHLMISKKCISWLFITFELSESAWLEPLRNRPIPAEAETCEILDRLIGFYSGEFADRRSHLAHHGLAYLLAHLVRSAILLPEETAPDKAEVTSRGVDVLDKINQEIFLNLGDRHSVTNLARKAGMSPSHLRLVFRKQTGMGLGHYMQKIRLNTARRLLEETNLPIKQVAVQCGFSGSQSFARAFRTANGVSPQEFRRSIGATC